jgi:excisionase family DNA binding protein
VSNAIRISKDWMEHLMADLMTTNQVQQLLQVDRTTIYRMVESGRLPAIRVGKQWRFPRPEIERWLQAQAVVPGNGSISASAKPANTPAPSSPADSKLGNSSLRELLPLACVQLIQDAFADLLGVMMVITDMPGQPVTTISNPCGFYIALSQAPDALGQCMRSWRQLAANPAIEPKFYPNEMGLLCARGLIRVGSELKGMVVIGGIAPEAWPPNADQIAGLAEAFGLSLADVEANADAVYRLDKAAQDKALRFVQRTADICSHIAEERNALSGRLQAIASLTTL